MTNLSTICWTQKAVTVMCFDDVFMDFIGFMTDGTGELYDDDDICEDDEEEKKGEKK